MKTITRNLLLLAIAWAAAVSAVGCNTFERKAKEVEPRTASEAFAKSIESTYRVRIEGAKIGGQVSDGDIVDCARLISTLDQIYTFGAKIKRVEFISGNKDEIVVDGMNGMKWFVKCVRDPKGGWKVDQHGIVCK